WSLKTSNVKNDILSLSYTNPNKQEVSVVIEPQRQATLPPGLIISLELSDGQQESFHFERSLNVPNQISCNYSSNVACNLPTKFLIAKGESGQSLVKEICHKGTSNHYLEIVQLLSTMEPLSLC